MPPAARPGRPDDARRSVQAGRAERVQQCDAEGGAKPVRRSGHFLIDGTGFQHQGHGVDRAVRLSNRSGRIFQRCEKRVRRGRAAVAPARAREVRRLLLSPSRGCRSGKALLPRALPAALSAPSCPRVRLAEADLGGLLSRGEHPLDQAQYLAHRLSAFGVV
jgi:hypothetical protein